MINCFLCDFAENRLPLQSVLWEREQMILASFMPCSLKDDAIQKSFHSSEHSGDKDIPHNGRLYMTRGHRSVAVAITLTL